MHAGWLIHHTHGDTAAFHAATPDPVRSVTFHTVARPTLALGSAQQPSDVDTRVAEALGVEVVQRRSGGGAVLMLPGEFVWADVVIPASDPLWSPDVAQAMVWVGEWWVAALAALGVRPGPWLNALKNAVRTAAPADTPIELAPGDRRPVGELRQALLVETPGQKIAYVVDTLFSPANAARVVRLARGADLFYCEAPFLDEDLEQATRRYHLTARQAGALARAAGSGCSGLG